MSLFCVTVQVSLHLHDRVRCMYGIAFNEQALQAVVTWHWLISE